MEREDTFNFLSDDEGRKKLEEAILFEKKMGVLPEGQVVHAILFEYEEEVIGGWIVKEGADILVLQTLIGTKKEHYNEKVSQEMKIIIENEIKVRIAFSNLFHGLFQRHWFLFSPCLPINIYREVFKFAKKKILFYYIKNEIGNRRVAG